MVLYRNIIEVELGNGTFNDVFPDSFIQIVKLDFNVSVFFFVGDLYNGLFLEGNGGSLTAGESDIQFYFLAVILIIPGKAILTL